MKEFKEKQTPAIKSTIIVCFILLFLVVIAGLVLLLKADNGLEAALKENNVMLFDAPRNVPAVSLRRHDGTVFTTEQFNGHWNLINFGYTYCPDICPTNMADMKIAYNQLVEAGLADQINFWMITVDPQRDTEQQLSLYVPFFHPDFVGLTGDPEQIATLATQLSAVYYREGEGEGYTVAHSDNYAIIDPDGEFIALMRPPHKPDHIVTVLTQLIDNSDSIN
jgi:protein SCO1/2